MTILEQVAGYALTLKKETMQQKAVALGRAFFLDAIGCIIAGAQQRPSRLALEYCLKMYGNRQNTATVLGTGGLRLSACSAAFVNGISSHFHDYDDMLPTLSGHPSATVLPCVLALCEELDKSGKDALEAYMLGIEITDIMARGLNSKTLVHYSRGWHSTQTIGIFGATAAAGFLLGLTEPQLTVALSIAASEASGLQGNFGTMTKAFHAGRAAEKAIAAAKLAAEGFTANPAVMEMTGGYAIASTGSLDTAAMAERMSSRESAFISPGLTMKPYPCCKCAHNMIDAMWNLINRHGFYNEDVEKVLIGAQPLSVACLKYGNPTTMLQGKFSAQYATALVLVNRALPGLPEFEGAEITDRRVIETMGKITMVQDDDIAHGQFFKGNWETRMTVTLKEGRSLEETVVYARGEAQNPMTPEEMTDKLSQCAAVSLIPEKVAAVVEFLENFERHPIRSLTETIEEAAKP
jgi:2-methylcitrate dehydratase PrpD